MTPEEIAYRDAWLAEMWPVCRGVDSFTPPRERLVRVDRKRCPHCRIAYSASYLARHMRSIHHALPGHVEAV